VLVYHLCLVMFPFLGQHELVLVKKTLPLNFLFYSQKKIDVVLHLCLLFLEKMRFEEIVAKRLLFLHFWGLRSGFQRTGQHQNLFFILFLLTFSDFVGRALLMSASNRTHDTILILLFQ
jgi:hypothetical protein